MTRRRLALLCLPTFVLLLLAAGGCDPIYRKAVPIDSRADLTPEKGESKVLQAIDDVARRWELRPVPAEQLAKPPRGGGVKLREYRQRYLYDKKRNKYQTIILTVVQRPKGKAEVVLREAITSEQSPLFRNVYGDLKAALGVN